MRFGLRALARFRAVRKRERLTAGKSGTAWRKGRTDLAMTANKIAQAGGFTFGELDLEQAWRDMAHGISRPDRRSARAGGGPMPLIRPGEGGFASSAEAHLRQYLESVRAASQGVNFSPVDMLTRRLSELVTPAGPRKPPADAQDENSEAEKDELPIRVQLEWFEDRFAELRKLVTEQKSEANELVSINAKLAEIVERVDALAKSLPAEPVVQTIEAQLADLAQTLNAIRSENTSGAAEMREAASTISEASARLERSRQALEQATGSALERVSKASEEAHSRVAITAEQITEALRRAIPENTMSRVEQELRALNIHARESGHRTSETLERVHETLREFLEKVHLPPQPESRAASPGKRLGVHMPITAGPTAFSRADARFGTASTAGNEDHLRHLVERDETRARPSRGTPPAGAYDLDAEDDPLRPNAPVPAFLRKTRGFENHTPQRSRTHVLMPDDSRSVPVIGIGIVVVILVLASAALLYLRATATETLPRPHSAHRNSAAEDVIDLTPSREEAAAPQQNRQAATGHAVQPSGEVYGIASHLLQSSIPALIERTVPGSSKTGPIDVSRLTPAEDEDVQALAMAASQGDREAQYRIGRRFLTDKSIRSNAAAAGRWLGRAAEQGHVEAQYLLGSLFERGIGVGKDDGKALDWYRRAAEAGHVTAMHNLGVLFTGQNGLAADYAQAFKWFTKAAGHGVADSQFNLAILYENGLGTARDERAAYFWYSVAGVNGDQDAKAQARRVRRRLSPEIAAEVDLEVQAWSPAPPPLLEEAAGQRIHLPG